MSIQKDGIMSIASGIEMMIVSLILILVAPFSLILFFVAPQLVLVTPILFLISILVNIIGLFLCLKAPDDMTNKNAIYIAIGLQSISTLVTLTSIFGILTSPIIGSIGSFCSIASQVALITFFSHVSTYISKPDLRGYFINLRNTLVFLLAFAVVLPLLLNILPPIISGLAGLIVLGFGIVVFIQYWSLLGSLKSALRSAAAQA